MINSEVMNELEQIVGERFVSDEPEIQFLYHYDFITAEPEGKCDIAIMPETAEEVQESRQADRPAPRAAQALVADRQ